MNPQKLAVILASHSLWISSREDLGKRANLRDVDLKGADLRGANLEIANLAGADLRGVNLRDANLAGADLRGANLGGADLLGASLRGANLWRVNLGSASLQGVDLQGVNLRGSILENVKLRGANLQWADLGGANLTGAILRDANLEGAGLRGAILRNAILDGAIFDGANLDAANLDGAIFAENWQIVPLVGQSFTAFKKVRGEIVLELLIPGSATRTSSLIGRKCRADAALVVGVAYGDAVNNAGICKSLHDSRFTYEIGKMASEPSFDPDIRVECTAGIHFFMTKEEAFNYKF